MLVIFWSPKCILQLCKLFVVIALSLLIIAISFELLRFTTLDLKAISPIWDYGVVLDLN